MAERTKIEWADSTFNPWIGCTKVGPGCDHCYAEARDLRFHGGRHWGLGAFRKRTSAANWREPLKWDREAAESGDPRLVFCASLADVFDKEVPAEWRADLFDLIRETRALTWIIFTKRIGLVPRSLPADWGAGYPNVWLVATVVNQEEADRDVPRLLRVPAAVHGVCLEPLLAPVDLDKLETPTHRFSALVGQTCERVSAGAPMSKYGLRVVDPFGPRIDWVIVGGESGLKARPMHPDWPRAVRDQCQAAGVPFFFKQHGEWRVDMDFVRERGLPDERYIKATDARYIDGYGQLFVKVGKKAAGHLLDGREWLEFPGARA